MHDHIRLWLSNAEKTAYFGNSLKKSIYTTPLDILWSGPVGAGKSTAIRAFAHALGVEEHVVSPTFALEQHYNTAGDIPLLHIDLYRVSDADARMLLAQTDDHRGIRCIEWAERSGRSTPLPCITVTMAEDGDGRSASIAFDDMALPDDERITSWRDAVKTPDLVRAHCEAVANVACACADALIDRGTVVRRAALKQAARLHDLLRFVDFSDEVWSQTPSDVTRTWSEWRTRFTGKRHEDACADFMVQEGFTDLATIIRTHGLRLPSPARVTIEQQLLYYADKRVAFDNVVTLQERFEDFRKRYGSGADDKASIWLQEAKGIERELFPEGPPL